MSRRIKSKPVESGHPRPWAHYRPKQEPRISAVVDAKGGLVCGSMICSQPPEQIKAHALIVKAVNGYGDLIKP